MPMRYKKIRANSIIQRDIMSHSGNESENASENEGVETLHFCDESNDVKESERTKVVPKKHNKITTLTNLSFNVNLFKKMILDKLAGNKLYISGAHVLLTAMNEKLCQIIIEEVTTRKDADKVSMYNICERDIFDAIEVIPDLRENIHAYTSKYVSSLNYSSTYPINPKDLTNFIDFSLGGSIKLDQSGHNAIAFILLRTSMRIIDTALEILKAFNKKTMNISIVITCMNIHFSGDLKNKLTLKMQETARLYGEGTAKKVDARKIKSDAIDTAKAPSTKLDIDETE